MCSPSPPPQQFIPAPAPVQPKVVKAPSQPKTLRAGKEDRRSAAASLGGYSISSSARGLGGVPVTEKKLLGQ